MGNQLHPENFSICMGYTLQVSPGITPAVTLCKDQTMSSVTGGSETFKDKQDFFYHEVRKYHQKHYHEKLQMKVNREKLLESVSGCFTFRCLCPEYSAPSLMIQT
jgi:hypothetical protein